MATCPDRRFRDPVLAVASARKAVELEGGKDYRYLDVLAAGAANDGKFADAIATQTKAIELAGTGEDATRLRQRLDLYQKNQPYRARPARGPTTRRGSRGIRISLSASSPSRGRGRRGGH